MNDAGHGGEGVKDWTKAQSDQITSLYRSLKGDYQKIADKELFGGPQIPYDKAHSILTEILKKQEGHEESGLESKVNESSQSGLFLTPQQSAAGLAIIALLMGIPYL